MDVSAGRELDALVAERVFGWSVERQAGNSPWLVGHGRNRWTRIENHPFSTDIAAAWEVVEKLQGFDTNRDEPWWSVAVFFGQPGQVCARVYACQPGWLITDTDTVISEAHADTAALAICRAALAAPGAA